MASLTDAAVVKVAIANPEILASRWPLETRSGFLWQLTALDGLLDSVFADPLHHALETLLG